MLGLAAIIAGITLLAAASGALGRCPHYAKLGHNPRTLRSPR